jgi:tetratricopeptide (TPR) repeat protein
MKSRLMTRLESAIASSSHPLKADCLRAERACLLARQGDLDEARAVLSSLHMQYASEGSASMSVWLCLGEGLLSYFGDMNRAALDKMRRAYALSATVRDPSLHALTAAWLAHMAYVDHDLESMARYAVEALRTAEADHHAALARANLVMAQAYHFAGRYDLAQPWYARARHHGTADGDDAMLSAVMHNMAGLHTHLARQAALGDPQHALVAKRALLITESTSNFDALVGTTSLDAFVPLLRAQVLVLQDRWAEALSLYEAHFANGLVQGLNRMRSKLGADMAWCRLQLGQTERALKDALEAEIAAAQDRDIDDRASAHSRLAQVFAQLGRAEAAARHAERAAALWRTHESDQAQALALMEEAVATLTHA